MPRFSILVTDYDKHVKRDDAERGLMSIGLQFFKDYELIIWEADYWKNIILYTDGNDPIYEAKTDTTFSIYNKKFVRRVGYMGWDGEFFIAPRVCGRYTCKHWGWYYKKPIPENEDKFGKEKVGLWSSTQNELIKRGIDA